MAGTRRDQREKPGASVNAPADMGEAMAAVRSMPESLAAEAAVLGSMLSCCQNSFGKPVRLSGCWPRQSSIR